MRKVSWLVAGTSLLLSIALISGCGYAKRDQVEKQLADQKMDADQKIQLAQDAAAEAGSKADKALETAREEIGKAKEEVIATAEEKDAETLATAESSMKTGDEEVKRSAEGAAAKALADAKAAAMAEDEKVKQAAKEAAGKALSAAEEADRKARRAADEAELAKTLPKPKEPIVFTVYFGLGQTKLKDEGLAELERAANTIKAHPDAVVSIEGHTDNVPVVHSTRYMNNWGLSQARATVVKNHLVEKLGVSAESIKETIGVAFYKPIAPNSVKDRHLNRRVDVIIMPQD
jgi:outer membrane protein OmpA-like peptidoglycan-associated protein